MTTCCASGSRLRAAARTGAILTIFGRAPMTYAMRTLGPLRDLHGDHRRGGRVPGLVGCNRIQRVRPLADLLRVPVHLVWRAGSRTDERAVVVVIGHARDPRAARVRG